jgi:integrase
MAIKKYVQKDRPSPFGVKWSKDGKRKFKFFRLKKNRDAFFDKLTAQEKNLGNSILDLNADEAATIRQCINMVGNTHDVILACKEFTEKNKIVDISPQAAIEEYLKEKELLGRDDNYIRAIKNILKRGRLELPVLFDDWKEIACHKWILGLNKDFEPVTIRTHAKTFNGFCNWCMNKKYMHGNPFKNAPIPDVIIKEVKFLKVEDAKKLFEAAVKYHPKAVAYLALNTFAGLRSSACARLPLEDINFKQKGITIQANIAKNKRRVYLDGHEPNLWYWLEWAKKNEPTGFNIKKHHWDKLRGKVAKKAGVKMPHNVLRHSFCSYHVALKGDAGKTATLLTQRGDVSILYEHYKGNASKGEAKKFFAVKP